MVSKVTKRRKALNKRLPGLLKKAEELSILCGVSACVVAYCPGEAKPVVWPSQSEAAMVVREYRKQPNLPRSKNEMGGLQLLEQRNAKVRAQISKVQQECRELEIKNVIVDSIEGRRANYDDLPLDLFVSVGQRVNSKLEAVKARLQEIRSGAAPALQPPPAPQNNVQMVERSPPQPDGPTPMTLDGHGSNIFKELDAILDARDLASTEDMEAAFDLEGMFD